MIGIVVCGHGQFGSMMAGVVRLVIGMPKNFAYADYRQEDTADDFEAHLNAAVQELEDDSEGILFFTDLSQGTPVRTAVALANAHAERHIIVLSGTTVGALTETSIARGYIHDIEVLADLAVEHGKKEVMRTETHIEENQE